MPLDILDQLNANSQDLSFLSKLNVNNSLLFFYDKFPSALSSIYNQDSATYTYVACFNKGTLILVLTSNFKDKWIPIEQLSVGMLVKTYQHGYRPIKFIINGVLKNNAVSPLDCMYKFPKNENMIKDLIITGGHSILVDEITNEDEYNKNIELFQGNLQKIDDKLLLLACVSNKFQKIEDDNDYTFYHLILENDGDINKRYGIWADGVLTETPSEEYYRSINTK